VLRSSLPAEVGPIKEDAMNKLSRSILTSVALVVFVTAILGTATASARDTAIRRGGKVVARISVDRGFGSIAVGEGAVWSTVWSTTNPASTLFRIDPQQNKVVARIPIKPGGELAAGAGAVWLSDPSDNTVLRIDPLTNEVIAKIEVGPQPDEVDVSQGAVWVANIRDPSVSRIDPTTNRVVATIRVGPARACCAEHMSLTGSPTGVWVSVARRNALVRIDPKTNKVAETVKLPYSPCADVAASKTVVWSAGGDCTDLVTRVDLATHGRRTAAEPHPVGVVFGFGSVWTSALYGPWVDRIAPRTGRIVGRVRIAGLPVLLASGFGAIWVHEDTGHVLRIEP
jgi:YVTN family beta-propeller protein